MKRVLEEIVLLVLLISGCALTPESERQMRIVEHQKCVQATGSYVTCKHLEIYN